MWNSCGRASAEKITRKSAVYIRKSRAEARNSSVTRYIIGSRTRSSYLSFGLSLASELQSQEPPLLLTWSEYCLIYPTKGQIAYLAGLPAVARRQARSGSSRRFQNDRKAFGLLW